MRIPDRPHPKTARMAQTTAPDITYETARRVHSGRALPATIRSANLSSGLTFYPQRAAEGTRDRSLRALRPPLRVPRICLGDDARASSDDCRRNHRYLYGWRKTWTKRYQSLSATPRRRPFSDPKFDMPISGNSRSGKCFHFFPDRTFRISVHWPFRKQRLSVPAAWAIRSSAT